ncbi:MAG: hypothetical protein JWO05_367 [Gemmatimonadetes bacterium]|nr:hypothetical protein [Gemmatimonadota bacterium]
MTRTSSVRRIATAASLAVGVLACKDKKLASVDTGITKDSLLSIMAVDAKNTGSPDAFPSIYRRDQFLIGGKSWDVLYYLPSGEKLQPAAKDTLSWDKLSPIVTIDNKVVGKGWDYWDSVSTANKIPLKPRTEAGKKEAARRDSLMRSKGDSALQKELEDKGLLPKSTTPATKKP